MKPATRNVLVAVIAIVAVALAAATLESTVVPEPGGPDGPGIIGDQGEGGLLPPPQSRPASEFSLDIPFLFEILVIAAVIALVISILGMVVYWRETLQLLAAAIAVFAIIYLLLEVLGIGAGPKEMPTGQIGNGSFLGGGGGGEVDTSQPSPPSVILLAILSIAFIATAIAIVRARGAPREDTANEAGPSGTDPAAVGRAAGRAADRLDGETDVDNEVYRAWREMTELLDVEDPETSTPGEFASAAVQAGLGRTDVEELTRLFEDVRYGPTPPSEPLERRASTVFRRIEDRYAEEE